jgi:hypothetical protein
VFSDVSAQQLLKEFLDEGNWNCTTIRLLCKLCWATTQYLEANILKRDPQFEDLIPQLCDSLILLFPVIEIHHGEDNPGMSCLSQCDQGFPPESAPVRSLIVEALSLIPVKMISSSLKKILRNKQFLSKLDECT